MSAAATFAAAYGFVPPKVLEEEGAAIGLLVNAPRVRAIRALDMAAAIAAGNGSEEAHARLLERAGSSPAEVLRFRAESFAERRRAEFLNGR